jgi:hypothetical protein
MQAVVRKVCNHEIGTFYVFFIQGVEDGLVSQHLSPLNVMSIFMYNECNA